MVLKIKCDVKYIVGPTFLGDPENIFGYVKHISKIPLLANSLNNVNNLKYMYANSEMPNIIEHLNLHRCINE